MKTGIRIAFILLIFAFFSGCFSVAFQDTVTQVSTIDALLAGAYDGELSCGKLLLYGDTGIGTFDKLDGEMVLSDGIVYQIKSDAKVYRPSLELTTPFATVVKFQADKSVKINKEMNLGQFEQELDRQCSDANGFYSVRVVRGKFSRMKTRSVPAQNKPYPPLAKAAEQQAVFEMTDISGTIVGFRCPAYVKGINVPGYHLHFISDDLKSGGHILDFVMEEGNTEIDFCSRFLMLLPRNNTMLNQVDFTKDRTEELEQVETRNK